MEEEASARQAGASASCVGMEGEAWWGVGLTHFQSHSAPGYQLGSTSALRQGYLSSVAVPANGQDGCNRLSQFEFFYMCLLIHMTRNMGKQQ